MTILTAKQAHDSLYKLIDEIAMTRNSVFIKGEQHTAVLISESYWNSIQETLYLLSVPGMRESIQRGLNTPLEECN